MIVPVGWLSKFDFVLPTINQNVSWGYIFTFKIFILLTNPPLLKQVLRISEH